MMRYSTICTGVAAGVLVGLLAAAALAGKPEDGKEPAMQQAATSAGSPPATGTAGETVIALPAIQRR